MDIREQNSRRWRWAAFIAIFALGGGILIAVAVGKIPSDSLWFVPLGVVLLLVQAGLAISFIRR